MERTANDRDMLACGYEEKTSVAGRVRIEVTGAKAVPEIKCMIPRSVQDVST